MSALRQLLASLWAAVWLRWRLTAVRLRRLVGGRGGGDDAGAGYYLDAAETPVEGVDYDQAEVPEELMAKLELTRAELLDRAPRPTASPRRRAHGRRVASVATVAVLMLAVAGAGAAALIAGSTGVPAVDRLLGIYESTLQEPGLQPSPSLRSASIDALAADGSRVVSSSYVSRDGNVCSAASDADATGRSLIGALVCTPADALADRLARDGGYIAAVNGRADQIVIRGFVGGRVASLAGRGPAGALDVRLGDGWTPGGTGLGSLRPFLALAPAGSAGGDISKGPDLRLLDPREYTLDGVTYDGDRIQIKR